MKTREVAAIALLLWWAFRKQLSGSAGVQFEITEPGFEGTDVIFISDWPPTWN